MALHTLQVTLGASATQISAVSIYARWVTVQNNATHAMRVGDSTATTSKGIQLASGAPGGSLTFTIGPTPGTPVDLSQVYIAGTAADVADVLYAD